MAAADFSAVTAKTAVTAEVFCVFDDLPRTARQRCEENPDIARLIYEFVGDPMPLRRLARTVDDQIQTEIICFLTSNVTITKRKFDSSRLGYDLSEMIASIASRITSVTGRATREIVLAFCDLLNDETVRSHSDIENIRTIKQHFGADLLPSAANVWWFGIHLRLKRTAPRPMLEAFLANGFLQRFVPSALRSLPPEARDLFFDDEMSVGRLVESGAADWRKIEVEDEPEIQYMPMWDTFAPSDEADRLALRRFSQSVLFERNRLVLLLLRENIWTTHPYWSLWGLLEVTHGFPKAVQIELLDRLEHTAGALFRERAGGASPALFMCRSHELHRETIMTWILDAGNLEHRLKLPYHVETRSFARQICQLLSSYAAEVPWPVVRILVDSVILEKDHWDRVRVAKYIVPKMPRAHAEDLRDHLQAVVDRHRATEGVIRRKVFHGWFPDDYGLHEWDSPVPPGFVDDCVSNFRRAMC